MPSSQDPGKAYVFVGGLDGMLHRLDVSGEAPYPTISVDTKRPSCTTFSFLERVITAPSAQLYAEANSAFRGRREPQDSGACIAASSRHPDDPPTPGRPRRRAEHRQVRAEGARRTMAEPTTPIAMSKVLMAVHRLTVSLKS